MMTPSALMIRIPVVRMLVLTTAMAGLAGCTSLKNFDWDMRRGGATLDTSDAARAATANRPAPDGRGVISYPGYQVALARRGDTVGSVAARVGLDVAELARYNALKPDGALRDGEVLALPRRVSEPAPVATAGAGAIVGAPIGTQGINVTSIASGAIDKAAAPPAASQPAGWQKGAEAASKAPGAEPVRHKVARGETAFIIARAYNVSARALADWNGLDADMTVREGQYLLIPTSVPNAAPPAAAAVAAVPAPGAGSPTPVPPSASKPLPEKDETVPAGAASAAASTAPKPQGTPPSPDLGENRTAASASKFAMPVGGNIIRGYEKKKNDGVDIAANPGTNVAAASDGTVAAITKDTEGVPILVIRHADNLLTVYAGIDAITVAKGATVKRGQAIAKVRAGTPSFLHFEVRKGFESVDPMPYLQ